MNITERIKNILLKPKEEWLVIDTESTTVADLYKSYIVPLAAIGPVASIIGSLIGGGSLYYAITGAVVSYVLGLVGVYVIALIIDALAPTFSGQKNSVQALKVVAYAWTAFWLTGIFSLIPVLAILAILGLYSLYLLYLGLPVLMKVPQDKALGYTVVVIVVGIVVVGVVTFISGVLIASRMMF
jgi:hypothetical protein